MEYYIIAFLFFYIFCFIKIHKKDKNHLFFIIGTLPIAFLAILRGNVGTDTYSYVTAFNEMQYGPYNYGAEPVFRFLVEGMWAIYPNAQFIISSLALITSFLFIWGAIRAKFGFYFVGLMLFPFFYMEFSMNMLRGGLAGAIFLIAAQYLIEKKDVKYISIAIISIGIHFSSAVLFLFFYLTVRKMRISYVITMASILASVYLYFPEYILEKSDLYKGFSASSGVSGIGPLTLSIMMLLIIIRFKSRFDISKISLSLLFLLTLVAFYTATISYAGLRFQTLFAYLIGVVMLFTYKNTEKNIPTSLLLSISFTGFIGLLLRFRNIINEPLDTYSHFLPYHFFSGINIF